MSDKVDMAHCCHCDTWNGVGYPNHGSVMQFACVNCGEVIKLERCSTCGQWFMDNILEDSVMTIEIVDADGRVVASRRVENDWYEAFPEALCDNFPRIEAGEVKSEELLTFPGGYTVNAIYEQKYTFRCDRCREYERRQAGVEGRYDELGSEELDEVRNAREPIQCESWEVDKSDV